MVTPSGDPLCDFCGDEDVRWVYPAHSIELADGFLGSSGAWAACETCHLLVESGAWTELAERSYRHNPIRPVLDKIGGRAEAIRMIRTLHQAFSLARIGPAHKMPGKG